MASGRLICRVVAAGALALAAGCAADSDRTDDAVLREDPAKVLQSAEVTVPTEEPTPTGVAVETTPTESTAAEESASGGVTMVRTHAILPDGTLEKLAPFVDPEDATWDSPTGIVTALVKPIQIFDPPGMDIEHVSITRSNIEFGGAHFAISVTARGDFTTDHLRWLNHEYPMFPDFAEPSRLADPSDGTFGPWTRHTKSSYHPDHPATGSTMEETLMASTVFPGGAFDSELAEPIQRFLDRFPDVVLNSSRLTWRPSEPNQLSASLKVTSPGGNQLELTRWIGARAIPETNRAAGIGLRATLEGEPEVIIDWSPDWQEDYLRVNFDYRLDDTGAPAVGANFGSLPAATGLIDWGQDWHLDDDGSVDAGWKRTDFNPIGWKHEPAPFHREESPDLFPTLVDTSREGMTSWFRTTFDLADPSSVDRLDLEAMVDDGLVVWLNGIELYRWNMPEGPVAPATQAVERISGPSELIVRRGIDLPSDALSAGENVVAVEVHQATADSSDIRFDLRMTGR